MTHPRRILALGPSQGWHAEQLCSAAKRHSAELVWGRYETLRTAFDSSGKLRIDCQLSPSPLAGETYDSTKLSTENSNREFNEHVDLSSFDHILARTMPPGSLEQITLRLSALHCLVDQGYHVINPPSTLELAIDKFRTLARISALGYDIPETVVVQTRREAMDAFSLFDQDVVVKPIFGGEGRGVMRILDKELAWYTFATLERIDAVMYVQRFVPPGGVDTRLLVIGNEVFGLRRYAHKGWKTNVSQGGRCEPTELSEHQRTLATRVATDFNLVIGSVDLLDRADGPPVVVEVNAIPGWKGAQTALGIPIAERMIETLIEREHRQNDEPQTPQSLTNH